MAKEPWEEDFKLVEKNVYLNREERKDPRGDEVMECDCRHRPDRPKSGICTDETCLNFATYTECIPGHCSKSCQNMRLRKGKTANVEVREAGGKGWGLFLKEDVKAGSFLVEYVGEVISAKELEKRKKQSRRDKHLYFLMVTPTEAIDATVMGGRARFVNHGCEPNTMAEKWRVGGEWRIGFFALRDMKVETELCIEYGWEASYGRKKTRCLCGAPTCRGWLEKDDSFAAQQAQSWSLQSGVLGTWRANRREDGEFGEGLVGKKVRVYRSDQLNWVEGTVDAFIPESGLYNVYHGDGSETEFNLATETWQIWSECEVFQIEKQETTEEASENKAATASPLVPPPSRSAPVTVGPLESLEFQVPFDAVGMIVGRGGDTIRKIIAETGVADIDLRKVPSKNIQIATVKGTTKAVHACQQRIHQIVKNFWANRAAYRPPPPIMSPPTAKEETPKPPAPKRRSKEELQDHLEKFDKERLCFGFEWKFHKALLHEVFGIGGSDGGRERRGGPTVTSPVLIRSLDLIDDIGNRLSVADPQLVNLHAAVLLLRYVTLKPQDDLSLVDAAAVSLFLAVKVHSQMGGRAVKEFFEVSYSCRYPGQSSQLVITSTSGNAATRELTQEGKIWEEKILTAEENMLQSLAFDIYFADPFEVARSRFLFPPPPPTSSPDSHAPPTSKWTPNDRTFLSTLNTILRKTGSTPIWLQHDAGVVVAGAVLAAQALTHSQQQWGGEDYVTSRITGGKDKSGDFPDGRTFLALPSEVKDLVGEPQARETLEAAEVCLRLDTTSPPYVGLLVTKIAEYLRVPRGQEEPPPPDLSKAPLLSAEVIPLLPEIKEIDFADETTLHKIKARFVQVKNNEASKKTLMAVPWGRKTKGQILLNRWPNEKSGQHESRLQKACGFNPGFSPAALREIFVLQHLNLDPLPKRDVPPRGVGVVTTPLCILQGANQTLPPSTDLLGSGLSWDSQWGSQPDIPPLAHSGSSNGGANGTGSASSPSPPPRFLAFERAHYTLNSIQRYIREKALPQTPFIKVLLRALLEAFRWCHERGVVIKVIDPNQIYLDLSGNIRLGCFDEAFVISHKGQEVAKVGRSERSEASKAKLEEVWEESKKRKKIIVAPEIILGGEAMPASDMWTFGCMACQMLLQRPLFDGKNNQQLMEHIYRVTGSYENVYKPGCNLPLYERCKPQKHSGYACRIEKALRELSDKAETSSSKRRGSKLEGLSEEGVRFLASLLVLDPSKRATAASAMRSPFFGGLDSGPNFERWKGMWEKMCRDIPPLSRQKIPSQHGLLQNTPPIATSPSQSPYDQPRASHRDHHGEHRSRLSKDEKGMDEDMDISDDDDGVLPLSRSNSGAPPPISSPLVRRESSSSSVGSGGGNGYHRPQHPHPYLHGHGTGSLALPPPALPLPPPHFDDNRGRKRRWDSNDDR